MAHFADQVEEDMDIDEYEENDGVGEEVILHDHDYAKISDRAIFKQVMAEDLILEMIQKLMTPEDARRSRLISQKWDQVFKTRFIAAEKNTEREMIGMRDFKKFVTAYAGAECNPYDNFCIPNQLFDSRFLENESKSNALVEFFNLFSNNIKCLKILISTEFSELHQILTKLSGLETLKISQWSSKKNKMYPSDAQILFEDGLPEVYEMNINFHIPRRIIGPCFPYLKSVYFEEKIKIRLLGFFQFIEKNAPQLVSVSFPHPGTTDFRDLVNLHSHFFSTYDVHQQLKFLKLNFNDLSDVAVNFLAKWSMEKNLKLKTFKMAKFVFMDQESSLDEFFNFLSIQSGSLKVLKLGKCSSWPKIVPPLIPLENEENQFEHMLLSDDDDESDADSDIIGSEGSNNEVEQVENDDHIMDEIEIENDLGFGSQEVDRLIRVPKQNQYEFLQQIKSCFGLVESLALRSKSFYVSMKHPMKTSQWPNLVELDLAYCTTPETEMRYFIKYSNVFPNVKKLTLSKNENTDVHDLLKVFKDKFPNVSSLNLHLMSDIFPLFSSIPEIYENWHSTLEDLTLNLYSTVYNESWRIIDIDQFMCGYNVKKFRAIGGNLFKPLEQKSSISDCHELREFTLNGLGSITDEGANLCFFDMPKLKTLYYYNAARESPYHFSLQLTNELKARGILIKEKLEG